MGKHHDSPPRAAPAVFARITKEGLELRIKVVPGARKTESAGVLGDRLKIRVAAAPERGKANDALLAFLAQCLGAKDLQLVSGQTSPEKTVLVIDCFELSATQLAALQGVKPHA